MTDLRQNKAHQRTAEVSSVYIETTLRTRRGRSVGAEPARDVAPQKKKATKSPAKLKRSHTARPSAKAPARVSREGSKKAEVIDLMRRPGGVSLAEIQELTGWQAHTVRGFVSILGE